MKSIDFPSTDSLQELQEYIWQMNKERGFNTEDVSKKFMILMEEVGELANAVRKTEGMRFAEDARQTDIKEELADVQIVLLGLASMLKIDMFEAVLEKEKINRKRTWK